MGAAGPQRAVLGGGARPVLVSGGAGTGTGIRTGPCRAGGALRRALMAGTAGVGGLGGAPPGEERSVRGRGFDPCPVPD